jgi:phosphoenolpyruvate carboxykinase (ATP)
MATIGAGHMGGRYSAPGRGAIARGNRKGSGGGRTSRRRLIVQETGLRNRAQGADKFGFKDLAAVHWNLDAPPLYEHAIRAGEASIVQGGPICAETGVHTGRSPKDKHTVVDALTEGSVWWEGNRKISQENFQRLYEDFIAHARGKKLFAQDLYGGADP